MVETATTTMARTAKDWRESPVSSHHHVSFLCVDPEETRRYYEDFLGFEFTAAYPSKATVDGKSVDVLNMLFRMKNGDFIGFHHLRGEKKTPLELAPLDMHFALKLPSEGAWNSWVQYLANAGVEYNGPLDHDFVRSVYFLDPNGIWLEFTYELANHEEQLRELETHARRNMAGWTVQTADVKKKARGN